MFSALILFLLLIACFLSIFQRKKTQLITISLTLAFFFMIGSGWFAAFLLRNLEEYPPLENPQWASRNAIVLLGAGAIKIPKSQLVKPTLFAFSRIQEAAHLYFSCKKRPRVCKVITSGGDPLATGKAEAIVYRDELLQLGVKAADIEVESESMNTYKNAQYTSIILQKGHYDRVFMVTSGIHEKRSLLYFAQFGVSAIPAPSDFISARVSVIPLGYNFAITDFAIHEYLGILRIHVYNFLGWNKDISSHGAP